jgi:sulfhydrogenase subunit delta
MKHPKAKVAFFDFAGCEGCQLTVLDALQTHPELLEAVEIFEFREAVSERKEGYEIAFVEGSCVWPMDEDRLRKIREQADVIVALGACAHMGGVNAIRRSVSPEQAAQIVYKEKSESYMLKGARPIDAVIRVDAVLPGCPIDRHEFLRAITMLLRGTLPQLPNDPVCVECRLKETACLLLNGQACLGPITRGGCGALCPGLGVGCEGCRGLLEDGNIHALEDNFLASGLGAEVFERKMSLFLSEQIHELQQHS